MKKNIYFNFPIAILKDYLINPKKCLYDTFRYVLWNYAKDLYFEYDNLFITDFDVNYYERCGLTEEEFWDIAENYSEDEEASEHKEMIELGKFFLAEMRFDVRAGNVKWSIKEGKRLVELYNDKKEPFTNITKTIYFDYYNNEKTQWQHIMLLAFLAVRSIIGNKSYCKISNDFLFSRMLGSKTKLSEEEILSSHVGKFYTEHYKKKIRQELEANWYLKTYNGRGYYASFDLSLKDLITNVKKSSTKYKMKEINAKKRLLDKEVTKELNAK